MSGACDKYRHVAIELYCGPDRDGSGSSVCFHDQTTTAEQCGQIAEDRIFLLQS